MIIGVITMDLQAHENSDILEGIADELQDIFDTSEQAIYLYLDDTHKVCNEAFASLLGYASAAEWSAVGESFPAVFVAEDSQHTLIHAYRAAMSRAVASSIEVEWKKKGGDTVRTVVILVPVEYEGERMALHFVTERL